MEVVEGLDGKMISAVVVIEQMLKICLPSMSVHSFIVGSFLRN